MLNYIVLLYCAYESGESSDYGVPVALLDSSSLSFSCLNKRLKNPVSLLSFDSFGEPGFVLVEDFGVLLLGFRYANGSLTLEYLVFVVLLYHLELTQVALVDFVHMVRVF
jgi:hypothetical protein